MNAPFKPRLLVVEDDEGLQRQLRWAYEDYEVLVASDREAAAHRRDQPLRLEGADAEAVRLG